MRLEYGRALREPIEIRGGNVVFESERSIPIRPEKIGTEAVDRQEQDVHARSPVVCIGVIKRVDPCIGCRADEQIAVNDEQILFVTDTTVF